MKAFDSKTYHAAFLKEAFGYRPDPPKQEGITIEEAVAEFERLLRSSPKLKDIQRLPFTGGNGRLDWMALALIQAGVLH